MSPGRLRTCAALAPAVLAASVWVREARADSVVVSKAGPTAGAWSFTREVYGSKLRPRDLTESEARALLHEPLTDASSEKAQALYALTAQLSKANLLAIGKRAHVSQVLLYDESPCVQVQAFDVASSTFTETAYKPDAAGTPECAAANETLRFSKVIRELESPLQPAKNAGTPFYASPWFWGGAAAAAVLGTLAYVVSSSSGSDTARIRIQGP
jgi:hypothetical protein